MNRDTALMVTCVLAVAVILVPARMLWIQSKMQRNVYVRNAPGKEEVADRLADLEVILARFLVEAEKIQPGDARIRRIRERWDGTLSEIESIRENVAFSIGKRSIVVCVREPKGNTLAKMNTCVFVLVHELAHIASIKYGHTPEFWTNMKFLLELAEATGIYADADHDPHDETLCGKRVGSSPISCVKKSTCESELVK